MGERLRLAASVVVDRDVDPLAEVLLGHRAIGEPVAGEDEGQHHASLVNAGAHDPRQSGGMTDQPHDSVAPPPPPSPVLPPPPAPTFPATTLASPPGMPAFHPRGVLFVNAFSKALTRASWVAGIASALIVIVLIAILGERYTLLLPPVVAAIGAVVGVTLAALTMPRRTRQSFEAFGWLGSREIRRFRARTASSPPTTPAAVQQWLALNPRSPATALARLELLAMLGRTDEAAAEQALLPAPTTDEDAVEQALARQFTAFIATGSLDSSELDTLQERLPRDTELRLELLVARAIAQARARLAQGSDDWRDPLLAVRPRLGSDATMTMIRDLWWKIALLMFGVGMAVALLSLLWPR